MMATLEWIKERKRLYLLSYNELLYLLNKYPKATPYPFSKSNSTKDQCTQTSPHCFTHYYGRTAYKNITFINDTQTTAVMTPSPHSRQQRAKRTVSPSATITPTVIMSPSPATKRKRRCNNIDITPSSKPIHVHTKQSIHRVHACAMKASHSLLHHLIDANDSENEDTPNHASYIRHTSNTANTANARGSKRKRSFRELNESHIYNGDMHQLVKTLTQCSIEENQPIKRRKISKKRVRSKLSPKDKDTKLRQERKHMLLKYYHMTEKESVKVDISPVKSIEVKICNKPKLVRTHNNAINANKTTKRKLIFNSNTVSFSMSNSYETIESLTPHKKSRESTKKSKTKNVKHSKRKNKPKMSSIPRLSKPKKAKQTSKKQDKKKSSKRRSSLLLQEARNPNANTNVLNTDNAKDDATFFGLLPELDEQNGEQCDALVSSSRNAMILEYEEKQMSHEEVIRFENSSTPRYGEIEKEWKVRNESIPDSYGSQKVVITKHHKYTPLWRASSKLPADEKRFDVNKLKAGNDLHPLQRYSDQYLNNEDISPNTKLAQNSMRSRASDAAEATHSQIVAKYQQNVTCFGNNTNANEDDADNHNTEQSLFENTDFSADQEKVNSLLADSNTENEEKYIEDLHIKWKEKMNRTKNKYSVFQYPQ